MKKLLWIILICGLSFAHTARGQERRSGNVSQRSSMMPSTNTTSSFRSNAVSSFAPSSDTERSSNIPKASDWKMMNQDERRGVVSNMSSRERSVFLQKMKENIVIDDIDIPANKQDLFKNVYTEYQNNQKQIKEKFHTDKNFDKLSDQEATARLNQSFDVGQQLLDNRKNYADKFLKFLTPQQVLKLFQTEGKMREKILDKKNDK